MKQILDLYSEYPVKFKFRGSGVAINQDPSPGEKIVEGQQCRVTFKRRETE
jgi:hypothetical protein